MGIGAPGTMAYPVDSMLFFSRSTGCGCGRREGGQIGGKAGLEERRIETPAKNLMRGV